MTCGRDAMRAGKDDDSVVVDVVVAWDRCGWLDMLCVEWQEMLSDAPMAGSVFLGVCGNIYHFCRLQRSTLREC